MEGSCTVNLVTQKQHFHGKDLHCKHSYTQTNTFFHGKELQCKPSYTTTNTFMEKRCTVNLLTQLQTL